MECDSCNAAISPNCWQGKAASFLPAHSKRIKKSMYHYFLDSITVLSGLEGFVIAENLACVFVSVCCGSSGGEGGRKTGGGVFRHSIVLAAFFHE